jgi:hypothetical protein
MSAAGIFYGGTAKGIIVQQSSLGKLVPTGRRLGAGIEAGRRVVR